MSDLVRRSDVLNIMKNVFATTLNVEVDVAIAGMMCEVKHLAKVEPDDTSEAYNEGLNDAWELAKKIVSNPGEGGFSVKELINIFETSLMKNVFNEYSAQEAIEIIEAYEKEQAEIKVGDVVTAYSTEGIVTKCNEDFVTVINKNGVSDKWAKFVCKKTGKHIDLSDLFKQIGGGTGES